MTASLSKKLRTVRWGEYRITQLFTPITVKRKLKGEELSLHGQFPAYSSDSENGGIVGYFDTPEFICDASNPKYVIFGDHTRAMSIARTSFSVLDNVKVLHPTVDNDNALLFIFSIWKKQIPNLGYKRHWGIAKKCIVQLPTQGKALDIAFMDSFIAELKEERIKEMEAESIAEQSAYLAACGLDNYELSKEEADALKSYCTYDWEKYNLKALFGKSTRGKRLRSEDRVPGTLPFVTAGEADEGVSAFIGNEVEVFEKNTTTIDMFGSAKYRNYRYGGDDHVAIVHTENVPMKAAVFITAACHKAAHTGKFDYGHNFYAKDADALDIMLPTKDGKPDYPAMELLISAIHKLVIKDVVCYAEKKTAAAKTIMAKDLQNVSEK